ncbi:uncharacterized protein LOC109855589 [Pseudomyrmex gracilis]|uniref:uncharacterized protein LOC109855589 n=1 Tax=Pseudomyrmex gracilis TaxID=219809 RepID=UPI0009957F0D|nr:uncharacterized protein LOC109855589 [Pseudomyrmex gracilis]
MNADMEEYYATNKFFLSQIGGWPYQSRALRVLLPCLLTAVQYSVVATELLLLHDTWGDVDIAVEGMITIIPIVGSNAKLINIVINNDKFRHLLQLMNDHWRLFNGKSERHVLRHYADIGRKVTKYYAAYCYTILLLYLLIPLIPRILDVAKPLNESRPLKMIYQAEYRIDKEKYYYPILLHAYLSSMITVGIVLTIDTTYIICVLHACSLFTAIRHVQMLDSTFTYATFVLLTLNVLIMSVIGLQLINKLGHTEEVIRYICVTVGVITHLICMCFPGQLLINRSAEIFDMAYCSQWYTFSTRSRTLLKILLHRSFFPCTLSAGRMFVMSLTMCSSVMQTATSYFTTLLSVK